jgi:hypothetical protein
MAQLLSIGSHYFPEKSQISQIRAKKEMLPGI